ncbi:MAG: hypothetical protein K9G57_02435 [Ignavibacteriales bacterium]|nr:hypothetical protein [Ignavibacteriales bacterium]MCF8435676.1 hypothetical protein [Ignavibacteriales bacterium]
MLKIKNIEFPEEIYLSKPEELINFESFGSNGNSELISAELEHILPYMSDRIKIQGGFFFSDENVRVEREIIYCGDQVFNSGIIINAGLRGIDSLYLIVVSAGFGVEKAVKKNFDENNYLRGYLWDMIGSEIVEKCADYLQQEIKTDAEEDGRKITNRYSPGYCGWSVAEQSKLFSILPEKFCGVSLSPSSLMSPAKSISGIIGSGVNVKYHEYACSICDAEHCFRRKNV